MFITWNKEEKMVSNTISKLGLNMIRRVSILETHAVTENALRSCSNVPGS